MMEINDSNATNDKDKATSTSPANESCKDIAFEEVIPEDSPPRRNIPEEPTIRKPSGKHIPVE